MENQDKVSELADAILVNPPTKEITFLGNNFDLKPLSFKYSKLIHSCLKPVQKQILKLASVQSTAVDALMIPKEMVDNPELATDLDLDVAEVLIEVAVHIASAYGVIFTSAQVEEAARLSEIVAFVNAQMEVQDREDFLFKPLMSVLRLVQTVG